MKRKVSMFKSCKDKTQPFYIPLKDWLKGLSTYRITINQIRSARNKKEINKLKSTLPVAAISGIFSGRKLKDLTEHTGLTCIDIDGKDNPKVDNLEDLKSIISQLPFVMYCGLSASGKGLYCIVELQYPQEHIQQFYALEKDFLDMGIIVDPSCKDVTRLRFFSYDENAYYNEAVISYDKRLDHSQVIKDSQTNDELINNQTDLNLESIETKAVAPEELTAEFTKELMEQMMNPIPKNRRFIMVDYGDRSWQEREVYNSLEPVFASRTDITKDPLDWFILCNRTVRDFGENGRYLFHDICQFYLGYTEKECDELYDKCLKKTYNYSRDKFFKILKSYGF